MKITDNTDNGAFTALEVEQANARHDLRLGDFNHITGIYAFVHVPTLRVYIGSSVNIGKRISQHIGAAKQGDRYCFPRALRELGIESFDIELLEKCSQKELTSREQFWILFYNSASLSGFNTIKNPGDSCYGTAVADVTRLRMSASNKAVFSSPEKRRVISERMKLRWENPESRRRLMRGMKFTASLPETKKKRSERAKKLFLEDLGYRKRLSESLKKTYSCPERRKQISERQKMRYSNPEERKRASEITKRFYAKQA
jgi:group I intron endonuclease